MDVVLLLFSFFFFFNDTATTEIYTLSLHDALPIYDPLPGGAAGQRRRHAIRQHARSEEHTSELHSRGHLVCRLLLEKKKKKKRQNFKIKKKIKKKKKNRNINNK